MEDAKSSYPFECCGILVGSYDAEKIVHEIYPVENRNEERARDRYEIDSKTFDDVDREAIGNGLSIIGIYHSHPDHPPTLSDFDKECAYVWSEYSYVIISVKRGEETELKSWCLDNERQAVEEDIRYESVSVSR
ncbi:MAG: M67 family metallopeptidase [Planctomycetes bacterium]|nr:M67 family metallopeptidase [Planctomycetota bacterium]